MDLSSEKTIEKIRKEVLLLIPSSEVKGFIIPSNPELFLKYLEKV
jgi:hypothetical protein